MVYPKGKRSNYVKLGAFFLAFLFTISLLFTLSSFSNAQGPLIAVKAPVNPQFLKYIDNLKKGKIKKQSIDGHGLGHIPPIVDLSHLRGQTPLGKWPAHTLPSSYDLRTVGKVSPVKDQGPCGSCWAFATYGSMESNLLPSELWDFSENNLKNTHGFDWGHCDGGNGYISMAYLGRWDGPIKESDDPYNPFSSYSPLGLTPQKHVQEVLMVPSGTNPLDNDAIKQAIMTYGAVDTGMYWDDTYFKEATNSYYFYGSEYSNHDVTIVGWDDNYDKNNFTPTPPGNGAFIIKNSWGDSWGDNGYFYASYYDTVLGKENYNFVFNNMEPTTNYSQVYEYDKFGWVDSYGYSTPTAWFANVFTATSNDSLKAVSFYTPSSNSSYTIYVYTNVTTVPNSGTLAMQKSGTIPYAGYHTVPLDSGGVPLTTGTKFSVIVQLTTPGYNYPIPVEYPYPGYCSAARAQSGQSYISSNGTTWTDFTTAEPNGNVCIKAFAGGGGGGGNYDGIYKDIGNALNLNVYVQTYDNGGTLLVYTFDTINMRVFWCSAVVNGVFDGSSVNPAINERVVFDFNTMTMTIINLGGSSTKSSFSFKSHPISQQAGTYGMYKFANAMIKPFDGIYKDIGDALNLNVYVQSYDNGGTLILYTFDTLTMVVLWDDQVVGNFFDGYPVNPAVRERAQFNFNNNMLTTINMDTAATQNFGTYKFANVPGGTVTTTNIFNNKHNNNNRVYPLYNL